MSPPTSAAETLDILVVGGGFSGVYMLYHLRSKGFRVKLHEASDVLGGVWSTSRYPGARVDSCVPFYEFSFQDLWKDWNWKESAPSAQDLRDYFRYVAEKLDLGKDIVFNSRWEAAQFDKGTNEWVSTMSTGQVVHSRLVVPCVGYCAKPYTPDIKGLDLFKGIAVHAARWPADGLDLSGKRVGVLGTGSTGVQIVQALPSVAAHLTVFQRTPNTALPLPLINLGVEEQDKTDYPQIYEKRSKSNFGFDFDLIEIPIMSVSAEERLETFERLWVEGGANFWLGNYYNVYADREGNKEAYAFWRSNVLPRIKNEALHEKLAPVVQRGPYGGKRPALEQTYFEMFDLPNVSLVDINGKTGTPIESISEMGVITSDGKTHDLDILILATGFDAVTGGFTTPAIQGADGTLLRDKWAEGVSTYLGCSTAGFPNMFFMYGPQAPTAFWNGPSAAEVQGAWLVDLLTHFRDKQHTRVEPSKEAEKEYSALVQTISSQALWGEAESWYMGANIPGKPREQLNFVGGAVAYMDRCRECEKNGYEGFNFY